MLPLTTPDLARRLTCIIASLCAAIALRAARQPAAAPLLVQLWGALRRRAGRFETLAARVQAGRPAVRRPPRPPARRRPPVGGPPRLPRSFAWLPRLAPETAVFGSQLQALLAEPELAGLLAAAPAAGRLLRPLCRMLGVRPAATLAPALLLPARPRPRRPAAPTRFAPEPHAPEPHAPEPDAPERQAPETPRPPGLRPRPARPWRLGSFLLPPRLDPTGPPQAPRPAAGSARRR